MTERRLIPSTPVDLGVRIVVALASAGVLAFVAPPVNLHWLQWFVYVPMFWVLRPTAERVPVRRWFLRTDTWLALAYGIVAEGAIFSWVVETIDRFSNLGPYAAVGILSLFSIVFGLPYVVMWWALPVVRRRFGTWWVLAFPAAVVVIEFAAMHVILFPYTQGIGQYRVPSTFQLVSLTGLWGVSFLVMLVNCALAEIIYRWRERRSLPLVWLGAAAATWGAVNLFGVIRYNQVEAHLAEAPVLRVAQIQDDIDMLDRMNSYPCETWNYWYGQSERIAPGSVDLVVWPEGGSVYPLNRRRSARKYRKAPCEDIDQPMDRLKELAKKLDAEVLVGATAIEFKESQAEGKKRVRTAYNSVYHVLPDGTSSRYDKLVPLPFGEYMPLADTFPWLAEMVKGPGRFGAGEQPVVFEGKARLATPICYEAILPHVCRRYPQPDLLVNGTLDTWFGDTAASHLHGMLATARAQELGIPLFRSAYTGTSFVTEPHGRIYAETPLFVESNRIVKVRLGRVWTLYSALTPYHLQDWFAWLCLIGLVAGRIASPWLRQDELNPE